jgi:hypothetical protein
MYIPQAQSIITAGLALTGTLTKRTYFLLKPPCLFLPHVQTHP